MRSRKMKHRDERMTACGDMVIIPHRDSPEVIKPTEVFPSYSHFRLEVGCGKGAYVCGESERHPNTAYFALEVLSDIIIHAAERAISLERKNVRFVNANATLLPSIFPPESFDVIHINFCDPWPRARHEKRRLTSRGFLALFRPLLKKDGYITFKTDNADLFEFSIPEFEASGFDVRDITRDLHESEYSGCDTETEYEKNFSEKGVPICRLTAHLR